MARLRLTSAARRDLSAIQDLGLIEFGLSATRRHMAGFERKFALLRAHPEAGQERPEFGEKIRALPHPPHRILYLIASDEVLIVRILHSARRALRLDIVQ